MTRQQKNLVSTDNWFERLEAKDKTRPFEAKSLNEECGLFGIWGHQYASKLTFFGLHALQHRGQEGVGIVSNDSGKLQQNAVWV